QLAADTMQALKASRSLPHARGSSEGLGVIPRVLDESTVFFTTLIEGISITPGVLNEVKVTSEAKADSEIDWGSKNESDYSEEENIDEDEKIDWLYSDKE
nr:hypothetical protein [Tanacetum cinerariifolium]